MTTVNPAGLPASLTDPPPPSTATASSKDQFLKLLVAQLQHQDPLTPQDGTAFIAQLAQFASLEQSAETNERLADLQSSQAANLHAGYTNLVGRTVTAKCDTLDLPADPTNPPSVHLDGTAKTTDVVITDDTGKEVRTLHLGAQAQGDTPLTFDGNDASGKPLPPGHYHLQVRASGTDGSTVSAYTTIHGIVSAVSFDGGQVRFRIGTQKIAPGDITAIER